MNQKKSAEQVKGSPETKNETSETQQSPSLGQLFSRHRLKKKLTRDEVAAKLRLNVNVIKALENDQEIEGVSTTYSRGYQRAYLRLLELDEAELGLGDATPIASINAYKKLRVMDNTVAIRTGKRGLKHSLLLLLLALIVLALVFFWPKLKSLVASTNQTFSQTFTAVSLDDGDDQSQVSIAAQTEKPKDPLDQVTTAVAIDNQPVETSSVSVINDVETLALADVQTESAAEIALEISTDTEISAGKEPIESADSNNDEVVAADEVSTVSEVQLDQQALTQALTDDAAEQTAIDDEIKVEGESVKEQTAVEQTLKQNSAVAGIDDEELESDLTSGLDAVTFISDSESWLEVTDADSKRLYRDILGVDQITVNGALPLNVLVGNLPAVKIQLNSGEIRSVEGYSEQTSVARFKLEKTASGRLKFTKL